MFRICDEITNLLRYQRIRDIGVCHSYDLRRQLHALQAVQGKQLICGGFSVIVYCFTHDQTTSSAEYRVILLLNTNFLRRDGADGKNVAGVCHS